MSLFARIKNDIVVEMRDFSVSPKGYYTPEIVNTWLPCSKRVDIGWVWNGEQFDGPPDIVLPEPPEPSYEEQRQAEILARHPVPQQLEALTEAAENPSRPDKLNALLADIQDIKARYPKPEQT